MFYPFQLQSPLQCRSQSSSFSLLCLFVYIAHCLHATSYKVRRRRHWTFGRCQLLLARWLACRGHFGGQFHQFQLCAQPVHTHTRCTEGMPTRSPANRAAALCAGLWLAACGAVPTVRTRQWCRRPAALLAQTARSRSIRPEQRWLWTTEEGCATTCILLLSLAIVGWWHVVDRPIAHATHAVVY